MKKATPPVYPRASHSTVLSYERTSYVTIAANLMQGEKSDGATTCENIDSI
jgi:hypothetical protein